MPSGSSAGEADKPPASPAPLVAERYRRLAEAFTRRVEEVPTDRWDSPSPCRGWTARDVVQHVADNASLFLGLVGQPAPAGPPAAEDPEATWRAACDAVQAAVDDPAVASLRYDGYTGPATFAGAVDGFVCFDLLVHCWDLARATGLEERLDPVEVARVQAQAEAFGDLLRGPGVCAQPVPAPPDADAQTRLLAFLGRHV